MPNRIHSRVYALLFSWVARDSCEGFRPGILARMSRRDYCGLVAPPMQAESGSDVEEFGYCVLSLTDDQRKIVIAWCVMEAKEWENFGMRTTKLSRRQLRRMIRQILRELQDLAVSRGLISIEDSEMENAS